MGRDERSGRRAARVQASTLRQSGRTETSEGSEEAADYVTEIPNTTSSAGGRSKPTRRRDRKENADGLTLREKKLAIGGGGHRRGGRRDRHSSSNHRGRRGGLDESAATVLSEAPTPGAVRMTHPDRQTDSDGDFTTKSKSESFHLKFSDDNLPVANEAQVEAELAIEDDEEYLKEAEKEAKKKFLAGITPADEFDKEADDAKQRRKYLIVGGIVLLVVIVGVVIAVLVGGGGGGGSDEEPPDPTSSPTITVDPEFSSDICEDAIQIFPQSETLRIGTTNAATSDDGLQLCGDLRSNGIGVWYFMEGTGEIINANTCNEDNTLDTQLSIFFGDDCNSLKCMEGNDQRTTCASDGSQLYFRAEVGTRYYIFVHGNRFDQGIFSLSLEPEENNSQCANARRFELLEFSESPEIGLFGTTKFADDNDNTGDFAPPQCDDVQITAPGVWYVFESDIDMFLQAQIHDMTGRVNVYTGSCLGLECVTASDVGMAMWTATVGTQYFIFVHGTGVRVGDFALVISPGGVLTRDPDAPPNYRCTFAEPLSFTSSGDPIGLDSSTVEGVVPTNLNIQSCGDGVIITSKSLWYAVNGTGNGLLVSTCDTTSGFDTQLSVFQGSCDGNLICVDGGDQNCNDQSAVAWKSEIGTTYYILVHGANGRVGDFNLTLEEIPLSSSAECDNARVIPLDGVTQLGTTAGTMIQNVIACQDVGEIFDGSVWYSVLGTGKQLIASTCDTLNDDNPSIVEIYTGSCNSLGCEATKTVHTCGQQMSVTWTSVEAQPYYIRIYGTATEDTGDFILSVNELDDNYNCPSVANSDPIVVGSTTIDSTRFVLDDNSPTEDSRTYLGSWHRVENDQEEDGMVSASVCSDITNIDVTLIVFAGTDCGTLTLIVVNDGQSCGAGSSVSWSATAGAVYYILVVGTGPNDIGNYELTIGVENNVCEHAIVVDTTGTVITGSTEFATQADDDLECFETAIPILGPSLWYAVVGTESVLEVTTCHPETNIDTRLSVYEGRTDGPSGSACQSLTCIAGNDNADGCGVQSMTRWFARENVVYYILVQGLSVGAFGLSVSPSSNGRCDAALRLPLDGSSVFGDMSTIPDSERVSTSHCSAESLPLLWYSLTGVGGQVTVDACGFNDDGNNGGGGGSASVPASQLSVSSGTCDDHTCFGMVSFCSATFPTRVGEEYHIAVVNDGMSRIELNADVTHDSCQTAIGPIQVGDTIRGTTAGATIDDLEDCDEIRNRGAGVFYKLIGTGGFITAHTCSIFTNFSTQLTLYEGSDIDGGNGNDDDCINTAQCILSREGNCDTNSWMMFATEINKTYYIRVSGVGDSSGNFVLAIN